jgi:light-regulated signal transduction histidine kinase (bacteriophytochrome)
LQAPLRAIRSYADLLALRYEQKGDHTAHEFISVIQKGAADMNELIQALLRYAQAGEDGMTKTTVRTEAVLDGALSHLQPLIDEKTAEVASGPLPAVTGDPVQLLQLFQNLIGNALKYSRPGVPPRIHVSAEKKTDGYTFAIRDNGQGIDLKNFERIFAPLKRLHGQEISGTGMGLAICKKIVLLHGGKIWLESEPDEGSTFYFTLPA